MTHVAMLLPHLLQTTRHHPVMLEEIEMAGALMLAPDSRSTSPSEPVGGYDGHFEGAEANRSGNQATRTARRLYSSTIIIQEAQSIRLY
jgi:hypothetical protein